MPRIKSEVPDDPKYHRTQLTRLIASIKRDNRKAGANYERFTKELLEIFTDLPPKSWRFRATTYRNPVFRVINRSTGQLNDFLHVFYGGITVSHKFFDEKYRSLFPKQKDFYGQGDSVRIDFAEFGPRKRARYLKAICEMVSKSKTFHVNYCVM